MFFVKLSATRKHKSSMKNKLVISLTVFAVVSAIPALFLLCSPTVNPYTDPANIRVEILPDTLISKDTIYASIGTAVNFKTYVYLLDIVQKVTVAFGDNTDTTIFTQSITSDTLFFSHIYSRADTFTLMVTAISGDHQKTGSIPVVVKPKPVQHLLITTDPSNQSVTAGQTATFSIVASGTNLQYQWQKDSVNISSATAASYTTPIVALTDNGSTYRCIVSNSVGKDTSASVTLTVQDTNFALLITQQPKSDTVVSTDTARFTVVATGSPTLAYQWKTNGSAISGATKSTNFRPINSSRLTPRLSTYRGVASGTSTRLRLSQ